MFTRYMIRFAALTAVLFSMIDVARAQSVPPPPAPCERNIIIARHTTSGAAPVPSGLQVEPLFDVTGLQSAVTISEGLAKLLRQTYVLKPAVEREAAPLTGADIAAIDQSGYTHLEYSCPLVVMGTPPPQWPWHTARTGVKSAIPYFWNYGAYGPVRVAVVDSGVADDRVPYLVDGWDHTQGDPTLDELGHGTSVAYLIQQSSSYWSDIIPIKVTDRTGMTTVRTLARGINEALKRRAHIINLSLAYHADPGVPQGRLNDYLKLIMSAGHEGGAQIIAAAGNQCDGLGTCDVFFPAAAGLGVIEGHYYDVISVGGLNPDGHPSSLSATDADIWAPMDHICSAVPYEVTSYGYNRRSGTSFATAQMTGTLALLTAYFGTFETYELDYMTEMLVNPYYGADRPQGSDTSRLSLCKTMAFLGYPIAECSDWNRLDPMAQPNQEGCMEEPADTWIATQNATVDTLLTGEDMGDDEDPIYGLSAPGGEAPTTPDRGGNVASWVSAGVSTAPGPTHCTSCDACVTAGGNELILNLRLTSYAWRYEHFRLKLVETSGVENYVTLDPLSRLMQNTTSSMFLEPVIEMRVRLPPYGLQYKEIWLMGTDNSNSNIWSGDKMLMLSSGCVPG